MTKKKGKKIEGVSNPNLIIKEKSSSYMYIDMPASVF
jgi:hypothetical protein